MPIDPDFLQPGGALASPVLQRALGQIGAAPQALDPGTRVGAYRIVRELGRGGMAIVYLAARADGEFEQDVALKLVRPDHDSPLAQELLRQERQVLADLQHPCIARLLDGGRADDGTLWFAMELVHGVRIDRWCRERALPLAARLRLFMQVCEAVQFAHSRLLIHRDIKPANILVARDDAVKLLDFGIAQLLAPDTATLLAERALTPGYASPEQLRGETVTTASDIFQLGRLLQCMLAQAPANADEAATATASTRLLPHDAVAAAPSVAATLPRDIEAIVGKAMHAQAAQRYATASELRGDVGNVLAQRPVQARSGGRGYRALCYLRRHRWSMAAAGVALVAFVATVSVFTWRLAQERDQARQSAQRANQVRDFMVGMFKVSDPNVNRGDKLTATQILERGAADAEHALRGQSALQANLLVVIGEVYSSLGDYPRAEPLLARAVALGRADARIARVEFAHALRLYAYVQHKLDRFADARALCDEAERLLRDQPQAQSELAAVLNLRGLALKHLNDFDGALASHSAALAIAQAAHDDERAASIGNSLGLLLYTMDRYGEAQAVYEQALGVLRRLFGERDTRTSAAEENLAQVLAAQEHFDQALALMQGAAATERELIGADNAEYAQTLNIMANIYSDAGRDGEAAATYENALAIEQRNGRGDGDDAASILNNLGSAYAKLKRYDEARACLQRSLAIHTQLNGADYAVLANAQTSLAEIDLEQGQPAHAEEILRDALRKVDGKLPPAHRFVVDARMALARALLAQQRADEARRLLLATIEGVPQAAENEAMIKELRELLGTLPGS